MTVADALDQFNAMKHHGEALAWTLPEAAGAPDPSTEDHYQGMLRYPGAGMPIFYVTQKDNDDPLGPGAEAPGGYLHVFRFGTRPTDGERLRSNLQVYGHDTKFTGPDPADTWARSLRFDGALQIDGRRLPAYEHPGGLAIVDDVLFMALDSPREAGAPTGQIVLFDLAADHERPVPIQNLPLDHRIDNLAVTIQPDGRYLIWVNGDSANVTAFYTTSSTDLRDDSLALVPVQTWDPGSSADYEGAGAAWPGGGAAHQSSAFIHEPDGTLFMVATRHSDGPDALGDDYADLYRVDPRTDGGFKLTRLGTRHLFCRYRMSGGAFDLDTRICNFAAAAGTYVSPSGELILYAMPHDDIDDADPDFVRLAEFRHRDVSREDSPLCRPRASAGGPYGVDEGGTAALSGSGSPAPDRPWIELYDDDHWNDRSIVVDYDDRALYELDNFEQLDGFGDTASSVRWRMPVGLDVVLYEDHGFSGRRIILRGTGRTETIADLQTQVVVPRLVEHPGREAGAALEFGDKASSLLFVGAPHDGAVSLAWDLDGDAVFGETGAGAVHGDEVGSAVTFVAGSLDGPGQAPVVVRATGPGGSVDDAAAVTIRNVAPSASFANMSGVIIAHETATLAFSDQHDPSAADQAAGFRYAYDCSGDGVFEIVETTAAFACSFPAAGTFTAHGQIADRDGGQRTYTTLVTVLTPSAAILQLVDQVRSVNLPQGIANALNAKLQGALHALGAGNVSGATAALEAFTRTVDAQRGKTITPAEADLLIAAARRIIASLDGACPHQRPPIKQPPGPR
jgi:hypothetical protein